MGLCLWVKSILSRIEKYYGKTKLLHDSFEVAITLKGIHAALEIVGGFLLTMLSPNKLNSIVLFFIREELAEDPGDAIANYLLKAIQSFSVGSQWFGVFYLLSHGAIKLFLVMMLWRRKYWAYPLTIVTLFSFIAYQVYRYSHTHSLWLMALTILDAALIPLTWLEYERIKKAPNPP